MGDHRLALFLEQLDQALLFLDQRVDAGSFVVQVDCNSQLLRPRWKSETVLTELFSRKMGNSGL
ncbi:hypothetical protein D3C84_1269150 [compost metagenome]